jgi:long-chain fatty acid transport protein
MRSLRHLLLATALLSAAGVRANNGLLFIGFGSESLGMGGADTAVARDTTALNTNPAGLAQVARRAFDAYGTLTYAVDVRHRDARGNDAGVEDRFTPTFGGAYAQRLDDTKLTVGAGLFVQGGAGNRFEDLATATGTRDELSARLAIFKLGPGLAYEAGALRVGASVAAVVATLEQKLFPDTSVVGPAPFFGIDVDELKATGVNARVGVQYLFSERLTLGMVYSSKTELDFKDGQLKSNQSAAGLGMVTYRDASIEGFALPQELSVGAAWKSADAKLLVSAKLAWLNWDDALNQQTITASDPSGPAVAQSLRRDSPLNWKDQYVWALGLAYTTDLRTTVYTTDLRTTVYGGVNWANNPVPPETLTPLLSAAIARKHLTTGFSHPLGGGWRLSGGMLYVLPEKVTYTNPSLQPLIGADSQERIEYFGINTMVSKSW